jgi:hypothetical protein
VSTSATAVWIDIADPADARRQALDALRALGGPAAAIDSESLDAAARLAGAGVAALGLGAPPARAIERPTSIGVPVSRVSPAPGRSRSPVRQILAVVDRGLELATPTIFVARVARGRTDV